MQYDSFKITKNNFREWLRVWRMDVSEGNPNNKDLLSFTKANKQKNIDLIKKEILRMGSIKVSFGIWVRFKRERNGTTERIKHYFHEKQPHIFTKNNEEEIAERYDEFVETIMGKVENWSGGE